MFYIFAQCIDGNLVNLQSKILINWLTSNYFIMLTLYFQRVIVYNPLIF